MHSVVSENLILWMLIKGKFRFNEFEQYKQPQWLYVHVHKHLLLFTNTELKMTNFFSAGLQLCIFDITYSFALMHTVQGLAILPSEHIWLS